MALEAYVHTREHLTVRETALLDALEAGAGRWRECGGWVKGDALEQACGRRFGSALYRMAPLKPTGKNPGLGFVIERRRCQDGRPDWEYRLTGYPPTWREARVNLIHVTVAGAVVRRALAPVPDQTAATQSALFGDT